MKGREHNYEYIFSWKLSVTLYIKHQSYEMNPYPYEFETFVRSELLAQHSSKQIARSFAQTKSLNRKYLLPIYGGITPPNKRYLKFRITGPPASRLLLVKLSIPHKLGQSNMGKRNYYVTCNINETSLFVNNKLNNVKVETVI